MDPHRPIPHPPPTAQDQLPSDEHSEFSDFPPIRVRNSTPNPPDTQSVISRSRDRSSAVQNYSERRSSPSQSPGPRLPRHSHRLPSKPVLGRKNIVNTVEVTVHNAPKSSSKRRLESLDSVDNNHRSKRQCLDLKDDVDWVKVEISDIKAYMRDIKMCMREIAEHLRGDVDYKLEEIIDRIRQLEL